MIDDFYNKTASIQRYKKTTGTNKMEYGTASEVPCHLQPMDAEMAVNIGGSISKMFVMWCDEDTDIREGDQVTIDSIEYKVKGIEDYDLGDEDDHKEVFLEKPLQ